MKKLLSFAIAAIMMLSSVSAFAAAIPAEEAANPKVWVTYDSYDEAYNQYIYNLNFDFNGTLKTITKSRTSYTGTGIQNMDIRLAIDTSVWNVEGENIYYEVADIGADGSAAYDAVEKKATFLLNYSDPTKFLATGEGVLAKLYLMPLDDTDFDPKAVKIDFAEVSFDVWTYTGAATPVYKTCYGNIGVADYASSNTFNTEVLKDVAVDGKIIVAHAENVSGVKATSTVDVTYEGTTKTFGDFGSLLGIEGEGEADGTVRFAVKAPASMDPNGFLFKINY